MKANETKVEEFLSANKTQFIIPVYQRNYDWGEKECNQLFNDIIDAGSSNTTNSTHFIGSIVYVFDDIYSSSDIKELTIIDGQQRLTTLTLICLALYSYYKKEGDEEQAVEILETYLINKFAPKEAQKLKLKPTSENNNALCYLLDNGEYKDFNEYSRIIENFNFFYKKINSNNAERVFYGFKKLVFVEISLDRKRDNPQRIFESLNSTGLELSQSDLIRNYILMGINSKEQNRIYRDYWEVIEQFAQEEDKNLSRVSDFIRDYLTLTGKEIPNKNKVYEEFKLKFPILNDIDKLEKLLQEIESLVHFYNKLLNPDNEPDTDIQQQLKYMRLLGIDVANPFLMKVYKDYNESIIDKVTFIKILNLIQSFIWRRTIVGLPTNALSRIFMALYSDITTSDYLESLEKALIKKTGNQRFPNDDEVIKSLRIKDICNIKSAYKEYFFSRLEENSIDLSKLKIEHIFPENPSDQWSRTLLEDEYNQMSKIYLNTIGNLTLSKNSDTIIEQSFIEKRDSEGSGYKYVNLWVNEYLSKIDEWDLSRLEERLDIITNRFLQIWPIPEGASTVVTTYSECNIFDASDPTYKKLEYAVFLDQRLEVDNITDLYIDIIKELFTKYPTIFTKPDISDLINLTKNQSMLRAPYAIDGTYYIETNYSSIYKIQKIKDILTILGLRDELYIKYRDPIANVISE